MKYKSIIKWANKEDLNSSRSDFSRDRQTLFLSLKNSGNILEKAVLDQDNFIGSVTFNTEEDAQFYIDKIKEIANTYNKTIVSTQIEAFE